MKITTDNINKIINILKLVRNSTALMELINGSEFMNVFNEDFAPELLNKSDVKASVFYSLFLKPENFGRLLKGEIGDISKEFVVDYIFDKLYLVLKEYSENKFDEDIDNEEKY